jgi:hypothetical protein
MKQRFSPATKLDCAHTKLNDLLQDAIKLQAAKHGRLFLLIVLGVVAPYTRVIADIGRIDHGKSRPTHQPAAESQSLLVKAENSILKVVKPRLPLAILTNRTSLLLMPQAFRHRGVGMAWFDRCVSFQHLTFPFD